MSYFILPAGSAHMLGADTPLIKCTERSNFIDAAALLDQANYIADAAQADAERARQQALGQGWEEGAQAAQADLDKSLARFATAIGEIEAHHARQVADAAYAATVAIIGELDDSTLVAKLVSQVLLKQKEQNGLTIHVAPDLQPKLAALCDATDGVPVVANPELGVAECQVVSANGRIIASLPVQLSMLRKRWGISDEGEGE